MRIGVIGKGGSGKTSLSWMMMQTAHHLGQDVYGLDADYNQHLAAAFGTRNTDIPALSDFQPTLVQHVLGKRTDFTPASFHKAVLPNTESNLLALNINDPWLGDFIKPVYPRLNLLRVGEFNAADKALRCYHVRTAAADIVMSHLKPLTSNQTLVVDFTAGVDPFASPIYLKLDVLVLAVEPTLKGAEVARQWRELLADAPVPLMLVANKVTDPDDVTWLQQTLAPQSLDAVLYQDPALRRMERGDVPGWDDLLPVNRESLLGLWAKITAARSPQNDNKRQEFLEDIAAKRLAAQK